MKLSLNTQIFIGAAAGIGIGAALNALGPEHPVSTPVLYAADIIGRGIFINLLKMILIPLVFTSIVVGIANLRAHAQIGRVWKLTLIYFFATSALAILLGLITVNVFRPGAGMDVTALQHGLASPQIQRMDLAQFLHSFISNLFANPVAAMADGQILPTIMFALFVGVALVVEGDRARNILAFFNEFFVLIMRMVDWIMRILPIGLMALLTNLVASQDAGLFLALGKFIAVVLGATLFHGFVSLPLILMGVARRSPAAFFSGMRQALVTAFSTSSSSATLPISLRCVEEELKVDKDVAGFVMPLGATINMDGTALYEAVAALFVANLVGVDLNLIQQMVVFLTAMIAAIGAPGIPSAGMVTMVMVLQSVGLPAEAIAILLPIDRLLDAVRTMVNVEGDAVGSCVVHRFTSAPDHS